MSSEVCPLQPAKPKGREILRRPLTLFLHPRLIFEGRANWVRDLVKLTGTCVISSLLWVSIGCTGPPKLAQSKEPNLTASSSCVVTLPNGRHNPGETPSCPGRPGRVWPNHSTGNHGNGKLWVTLPTDGKLLIHARKRRSEERRVGKECRL